MSGPWRLALLGERVEASPSPAMHNAMLRAAGLKGEYTARSCSAAELPGVLEELRDGRLDGAQATMPHKLAVASACDRLAGDAAIAGSVNTIVVEDGRLIGHSTDASGLEAALRVEQLYPEPGGSTVLLGAGGAALAVMLMLERARCADVVVAARRLNAAEEIARRFAGVVGIRALALDDPALGTALESARLVVNATPAGLDTLPVDPRRLGADATVVDLRYRPRPVDLVEASRALGLRSCDGLEMLLQQALQSFALWTGMEPPAEAARAALEAAAGVR